MEREGCRIMFYGSAGNWRLCCTNLSSLPISVSTKLAPQGLLLRALMSLNASSSNIVAFSFHPRIDPFHQDQGGLLVVSCWLFSLTQKSRSGVAKAGKPKHLDVIRDW
eukprot:656086-Pelagomonas_calceolata.AAC.1